MSNNSLFDLVNAQPQKNVIDRTIEYLGQYGASETIKALRMGVVIWNLNETRLYFMHRISIKEFELLMDANFETEIFADSYHDDNTTSMLLSDRFLQARSSARDLDPVYRQKSMKGEVERVFDTDELILLEPYCIELVAYNCIRLYLTNVKTCQLYLDLVQLDIDRFCITFGGHFSEKVTTWPALPLAYTKSAHVLARHGGISVPAFWSANDFLIRTKTVPPKIAQALCKTPLAFVDDALAFTDDPFKVCKLLQPSRFV